MENGKWEKVKGKWKMRNTKCTNFYLLFYTHFNYVYDAQMGKHDAAY